MPHMPCRALFLRVQQAFQDIYGHFAKLDFEERDPDEEDPAPGRTRARTETGDLSQVSGKSRSGSQRPSPRASPRHSRSAWRQEKPEDGTPDASPLDRGSRKSSIEKQLAKKASSLLLLPEVDFPKEDMILFDSEATVAFVFATLSSFKALLHENTVGALLEEFTLRLVDLIGPPAAHVRLPV
ncbi:unnamed protein product, partial [Durusdinium trenchii]